jgi:deazaflavin-dependent oxidoreductase (nitroreductase family)
MSREPDSYNQRVIETFRANDGFVEPGLDLLLLHHVGARSGRERVTPLAYWRVDDTSVAVLASNRGARKHPDWYHNLVANQDGQDRDRHRNVPRSSPCRHPQRTQQTAAPHRRTNPLRLRRAQPHRSRDPARHPRSTNRRHPAGREVGDAAQPWRFRRFGCLASVQELVELASVAYLINSGRTQNGHIRKDTRDVSRHTSTDRNGPICRRKCARVIARVRA